MRKLLSLFLTLTAGAASAHPGHLTELAGHTHWVAAGAFGAAVLVGLWGAMTGKKKDDPEAETDTGEREEEAA